MKAAIILKYDDFKEVSVLESPYLGADLGKC